MGATKIAEYQVEQNLFNSSHIDFNRKTLRSHAKQIFLAKFGF